MKFNELKLSSTMLDSLNKMGFSQASEIQQNAIPVIIDGKDVIAQAQTGTGKTAAFGIPLIEITEENQDLQHLILAPSRELASQITTELRKLAGAKNIRIVEIIGGVSYTIQERDLKRKPQIIVATPGRFMDNYDKGLFNLDKIKTFTLDEADEMLNFGFYKDIMKIHKSLPSKVQTLFFTATFNKKTKDLAQNILNKPVEIKVSSGLTTSAKIEQKFIFIKEKDKLTAMVNLLQMINPKGAIIFGRTKRRVDELTNALNSLGFKVVGIQGDMRQRERSQAMQKFRDGQINILVGTDVMARGIDVDSVDYVFNFDLPTEIEYYTHRIGRTGRAGRTGTAVSFVKDTEMNYFKEIMTQTNSTYEEWPVPSATDLKDVKAKEIELSVKNLLKGHNGDHIALGAEIEKNYSTKEMGIIIASLLLAKQVDTNDLRLTPEQAAVKDKSNKQRSKSDGKSRRFADKKNDSKKRDFKKPEYKANKF